MKTLHHIFSFASALAFVASAQATTYYFDISAYKNAYNAASSAEKEQVTVEKTSWTKVTEDASTTYQFWYSDSALTSAVKSIDLTDASNDLVFKNGNTNLYLGTDVTASSIKFENGNNHFMGTKEVTINVNDLTSNHDNYSIGFWGENINLNITGKVDNSSHSFAYAFGGFASNKQLKSLKINELTVSTHSSMQYYTVVSANNGAKNRGAENPDAIIQKVTSALSGTGEGKNIPNKFLTMGSEWTNEADAKTRALNSSTYIAINNLDGKAGIWVAGKEDSTGCLTAIFTNNTGEDAETIGSIWEGYYSCSNSATNQVYTYKKGGAKIALVMKSGSYGDDGVFQYSNGTQKLTGENLYWTGGTKIESGTLLVNYMASNKGDETHVHHGTLTLAKASGAELATFGAAVTKLTGTEWDHSSSFEMRVSEGIDVGGSFAFSDIKVSDGGGTIRVRLGTDNNDKLVYDALALTGDDAAGVVGKVSGTGAVKIELLDYQGGDQILDYQYLFARDRDVAKETWVKLISWQASADDSVEFVVDDACKTWSDEDGNLRNFEFYNGADGLYGAYILVAVPEPSTYAAIFGALALGLAIYRRRK